jgi:hypothetical protein
MKQKSISNLQKQLNMLEDEFKKSEVINEMYKKQLSKDIKKFNPKEIKNTPVVEVKYNIWQRVLKTLGIN